MDVVCRYSAGRSMMEYMSEHPTMRIGIVDNDELTLAALSAYLEHRFGAGSVVWRCVLGGKAVRLCRDDKTRPDALVLDMSLSDMDGAAVCRTIRGENESLPILAITSFPLHRFAAQIADAGGQGIVAKRNLRNIGMAVEQVADGLTYMPSELSDSMPGLRFETVDKAYARLSRAAERKPVALSEREEAIMSGYADGLTTQQVGERLGLSENTVKTHTRRAMVKLNARTRSQAIAIWLTEKWGHPET